MHDGETIAAIATPPGRGGIGVIRVSGSEASRIADKIIGLTPPPRMAHYATFLDSLGEIIDSGIAIFFPGPGSFTGEDIIEFQGHGGPVVQGMLLEQCLQNGARMARPGEFTERAFLNGKMDLAQAEAVADLIDSSSESAVRSAQRSLQGAFSNAVSSLVNETIELRVYVEAAIDFPEEEIDFLGDSRVIQDLGRIDKDLQDLLADANQGNLIRDGLTVVLAGPPNAGKSSLLNALAKTNRSIVSDTPGTTRDTIELHIQLDGLPVCLVDTAGLRKVNDHLETEGVRRTNEALCTADHALILQDDCSGEQGEALTLPEELEYTRVFNKIDLTDRKPGMFMVEETPALALSAKTSAGLDDLRKHLKRIAGFRDVDGATFIARNRHIDALQRAKFHLEAGRIHLVDGRAGELLAEELKLAQGCLSEITGEFTSDQLLGSIFASFCIGK